MTAAQCTWPAGRRRAGHMGGQAGRPGGGGWLGDREAREGKNMAKAKRPRRLKVHHTRLCAWCANPVHGDSVTVTFPDKEQATFHVVCLYQYRAVMWPWAAR